MPPKILIVGKKLEKVKNSFSSTIVDELLFVTACVSQEVEIVICGGCELHGNVQIIIDVIFHTCICVLCKTVQAAYRCSHAEIIVPMCTSDRRLAPACRQVVHQFIPSVCSSKKSSISLIIKKDIVSHL